MSLVLWFARLVVVHRLEGVVPCARCCCLSLLRIISPPCCLHKLQSHAQQRKHLRSLACHWFAYHGCFSNTAFTFSMVSGFSC